MSDPSLDQLKKRFIEIFGHPVESTPTTLPSTQQNDILASTGMDGLNKKLKKLKNLIIRFDSHIDMLKSYKNDPNLIQKHLNTNSYQTLESEIQVLIYNILRNHSNDMTPSQRKDFITTTSAFLNKLKNSRSCKSGSKESCVIMGGRRRKRRTKRSTTKKRRKTRMKRKNTRRRK